jgi:hypothetical protein
MFLYSNFVMLRAKEGMKKKAAECTLTDRDLLRDRENDMHEKFIALISFGLIHSHFQLLDTDTSKH